MSIFVGAKDGTLGFECKSCLARGDVLSLIARMNGLDTSTKGDFQRVLEIGMGLVGGAPSVSLERHAPPRRPSAAAGVRRVLAKCSRCVADADVTNWLRTRGLDPAAIDAGALAHALPTQTTGLPRFAVPWPRTGHRLVIPAYDRHGAVKTLRARRVRGEHRAKCLAPCGVPTAGAVLANPAGLALLRGDVGAPRIVVIVEGEPDLLSVPANDVAALGIIAADSWTPELGRALWDRDVVLALHDDLTGDGYAATVMNTVSGRTVVRDIFARGRRARKSEGGGKGRHDLNGLLIDGADLLAVVRDAEVVHDPEGAAFLAPEPAQSAPEAAPTPAAIEVPEVVQRARERALGALARIPLRETHRAVARVLIMRAWWHPFPSPSGLQVGQSFPMVGTIAAEAGGIHKQTVRKATEELERRGVISAIRRCTDDGSRDLTYLYTLSDQIVAEAMRQ
ncbi:hypothetical protein WME88_27630 [Sorangium sp. So ce216]